MNSIGTPALPGKTGGVDVSIDNANKVNFAPTRRADAARKQMFANIHALGATVLSEIMTQLPGKFSEVSQKLRSSRGVAQINFGNSFERSFTSTLAVSPWP